MPRRIACQLWSMVRNNNPRKIILLQYPNHPQHIQIPFIYMRLSIMRNLPAHIPLRSANQ